MADYKVYISSTYQDLKDHREKVIEFFHKLESRFELVSMEGYVASDLTPLAKCLNDVRECDIYVLVIANRYGYIPADAVNNPENLSITELEFRTAQENKKEILAFFADDKESSFAADKEDSEAAAQDKKTKLQSFKTRVRTKYLTHPEGFISPFHLALQVSESLMKKALLEFRLEEWRKYCCDRGMQFSEYLAIRTKNLFRAIIIHGQTRELGLNLINRFAIFTLNLSPQDVPSPMYFQDFLSAASYEKCRTLFLVNLHYTIFQNNDLEDISIKSFLQAVTQKLHRPLLIVLCCMEQSLQQQEMNFLKKFLEEFHGECSSATCNRIYFFLYIEDDDEDEPAIDKKIEDLKMSLPGAESYFYTLPRLKVLSRFEIKKWLNNYITKDEDRTLDLLDLHFNELKDPLSMKDAEKSIRKFIRRVNDKDQEILDILQ
jgi:hypothetical protein